MTTGGDALMRFLKHLIACGAVFACTVGGSGAASIVGSFDWNDDTLQGWSPADSWSNLSNPGTGGTGGDDGFLKIDMPATSGFPPEGWFALASTPASALFAGTWQQDMWVEFDFWAQDVEPEYVQVRWGGEDSTVWRSTVFDSDTSSMPVQTWTHLATPSFTDYADWDYGGGSQEDFVNDLANIDWIGVYVWRNGGAAQGYGIDNFNLMVPEPAEYIMMLASAVVIMLSVGRHRAWLPVKAG